MSDLQRIEAEILHWPGAELGPLTAGRKHKRLTIRYNGRERFMVLPSSASDHRAEQNQIRDLRKVLGELGAVRNERRKATVKRQRNKPERNPLAKAALAPVKADPWTALQQVQFAPQPKLSLWQRLLNFIRNSTRDGGSSSAARANNAPPVNNGD